MRACAEFERGVMSWQAYVDSNLLASGMVTAAGIYDLQGNPWAYSAGFAAQVAEVAAVSGHMHTGDPSGLAGTGVRPPSTLGPSPPPHTPLDHLIPPHLFTSSLSLPYLCRWLLRASSTCMSRDPATRCMGRRATTAWSSANVRAAHHRRALAARSRWRPWKAAAGAPCGRMRARVGAD